MAKVSVGLLSIFNHENQEWVLYRDRLEQWFQANEVTEDADKSGAKRRAILLSSLAESTYRLIRDLALPKEVGNLSYAEVTQLLDGHFKCKKCGFAERHRFHSAAQEIGESLPQWAARVRGLALHCSFPTATLNEELRDRFVLGMAAGPERERLFEEPLDALTLETALQLAEGVRCARDGARRTAAPAPLDVHQLAAGPAHRSRSRAAASGIQEKGSSNKCDVCGYLGHRGKECKFKNYTCRKCAEKGHLKRVCKNAAQANHFLQCDEEASDDGKQIIFNIRTVHGEPMQESVLVRNVCLSFEVDTGSAVTAISE